MSTATAFFMSTAPRPQTTPSRTSPLNGSTDQAAGSAGTTSRWPCNSSAGRSGSVPLTRATTFDRPGADSSSSGSRPASASKAATYSAAFRSRQSPPPRLVVSNWISSEANLVTSSWASVTDSAKFLLHCRRDHGADRLEGANHLIGRGAVVLDGAVPGPPYARHDRRSLGELCRVHLNLDPELVRGPRLGSDRQPDRVRRGLAYRCGGHRRRPAVRCVAADAVLHRHRRRIRRIPGSVRAGAVVPGNQDHRSSVLTSDVCVQQSFARPGAIQPHCGDGIRQVRMRKHALRTGSGVIAHESDSVNVAVLDPLDHAEILVAPREHDSPLIKLLEQQEIGRAH